jgi:S1-C subfamily serine protease
MRIRNVFAAALVAALLAGPVAMAQDAPASQPDNVYKKLLAEKSESIVSVKYVLKLHLSMGGQSQDREVNSEIRGVLLDSRGLVMTANTPFSPHVRNPNLEIKATPADIRVLFGSEETEFEARIVARDSNLDLAFLQILDLKERKVSPVSLAGEDTLDIGQELVGITRLPRGFDNAAVIGRIFVTAKVERPRTMWAIAGDFGGVGLPVFDMQGHPVGVLANQEGSEGVGDTQNPFGGGGARPFLLPLSTVNRSVKMAEQRATELLANVKKEAEAGAEKKPADGEEKPADTPKDGGDKKPEETPKGE